MFLSGWWHVNMMYYVISTSLGIHRGDGFYQQWGVGLRVLHKHQQQLQSCFHHQAELKEGDKMLETQAEVLKKY